MKSQTESVHVTLEFTPNPNTLKYSLNRALLSKGAYNFLNKEEADGQSPLAFRLFETPGVGGVMLGKDFVTVTKLEDGDWDTVHKNSSRIIQDHLSKNEPIFSGSLAEKIDAHESHQKSKTELEARICEILDNEIRPAVAMDGGDITFERYDNGVVYLYLQGSCSGCPSSTATLKLGIEARLKKEIPEIIEVVST